MEDIIHEIYTVGPSFKQAMAWMLCILPVLLHAACVSNAGCWQDLVDHCLSCREVSNFLWPFKLSSPKGGFINKRRTLDPPRKSYLALRHMLDEVTAFVKLGEAIGATARTITTIQK